MAQNFIGCDRDQVLLMPPSLREWLPEGHLAWFVLAAVEEMDLSGVYGAYRLDGHGRPAHDPGMMVALLLYAYEGAALLAGDRTGVCRGHRFPGAGESARPVV